MVSKVILRTLMVAALIVTAHAVKPISVGSLARHLLRSAHSFSYILPDSALDSLERADYLAAVLDNSLHRGDGQQETIWRSSDFEPRMFVAQRTRENTMRAEVPTKRRDPAKARMQRAKGQELACRLKAVEKATSINLPVILPSAEAVNKAITLNLPLVEAEWSLSKRRLPGAWIRPAVAPAPANPACEATKLKQIRIAVLKQGEAEQKLKLSIERVLANVNVTRTSCPKALQKPLAKTS
jgi:hypothetical protein